MRSPHRRRRAPARHIHPRRSATGQRHLPRRDGHRRLPVARGSDSAADVKAWIAAQNEFTRAYLDGIPQRPAIARRVAELLRARRCGATTSNCAAQLFAMKSRAAANQPLLVVMPANGNVAKERVVLDPCPRRQGPHDDRFLPRLLRRQARRRLAVRQRQRKRHAPTSMKWRRASGCPMSCRASIIRPPAAASSGRPTAAASTTRATRTTASAPPADRHFYQTVWFHALGTPISADRYVIGRDFPRIAEIDLHGSRNGQHLLAEVRNGDGGDIAFHLRDSAGQWTQIADFNDGIKRIEFGDDGRLYAMSIKDAPLGRIIAIPLADPALAKAIVVVPESNIGAEAATPAKIAALCALSRRRTQRGAHFHARWQAPAGSAGRTVVRGRHRRASRRRRCAGAHDELSLAADVVSLRCGAQPARAHQAERQASRSLRRRRRRARIRGVEGRHENPGQHHSSQGHAARRPQPGAAVRVRRATASA